MKKGILFYLIFISIHAQSQSNDEQQIRQILMQQTIAWNSGDVETFMSGYWKNDSLIFVGKNGVTHGWQTTLNNYKRGYPDTTAMGKLSFDILQVKKLSPEYYFVVGKWHLQRTIGDVGGHYTLLFKKNQRELANHRGSQQLKDFNRASIISIYYKNI